MNFHQGHWLHLLKKTCRKARILAGWSVTGQLYTAIKQVASVANKHSCCIYQVPCVKDLQMRLSLGVSNPNP